MILRKYKPSDCENLTRLFYNTIHSVNARDYTEEQLNAWATGDVNLEGWNKSLLENITVVVVEDDVIIGFGDIEKNGYLQRLYVHKDYQNIGVATLICNELENVVNTDKISVHASITAKAFFEQRGYNVIKEQMVERKDIFLTNYFMEK